MRVPSTVTRQPANLLLWELDAMLRRKWCTLERSAKMPWHSVLSLSILLGIGLETGCWSLADSHCGNLAGDLTCAEQAAGTYCDLCLVTNDGCRNDLPVEECRFPGLGEATQVSDSSSTISYGTGEDGAVTVDETLSMSTTMELPSACISNDDCSGPEPICNGDGECTACTEHAQCGEAACNFYTGECLSERIVHVGPGLEFDALEAAVASFTMLTAMEGTIIVHARDGSYRDTVVVDGGRTIAFLAYENDRPVWDNDESDTSPLSVSGVDSVVLLDRMTLTGSSEQVSGLHVTNAARAWVDRSRIVDNWGDGVLVTSGADVTFRNCFIGDDQIGANAVEIDGGTATILYSTLAAGVWDAAALSCSSPMSPILVRNSILVAQGNPDLLGNALDVNCSDVNMSNTATESFVSGKDNENVGQMVFPWDWFVGYGAGDLHLQNDGLTTFADVARWQIGDPLTDIDGEDRSGVDGAADYAGADLPVP